MKTEEQILRRSFVKHVTNIYGNRVSFDMQAGKDKKNFDWIYEAMHEFSSSKEARIKELEDALKTVMNNDFTSMLETVPEGVLHRGDTYNEAEQFDLAGSYEEDARYGGMDDNTHAIDGMILAWNTYVVPLQSEIKRLHEENKELRKRLDKLTEKEQ